MTNVDLVKQMYSDIASGNVAAALSVFDPAIQWHECEGMPFVNGSGIYSGPEAVVKNVFMQLPVVYDGFNVEPSEIFGADDKVSWSVIIQERIKRPVAHLKQMPHIHGR